MRIRRVDSTGDMLFGTGQASLWHNVPEAVALYVLYRLRLNYGEWFADMTLGTPWATQVLGERTQGTRDLVLQSQVINTPGVTGIAVYGSRFDPNTRSFNAEMVINTAYGEVQVILTRLPGDVPPAVTPFLGVTAGSGTTIQMRPANLSEGNPNITDFQIVSIDRGRY